jgi:hypothetical protein
MTIHFNVRACICVLLTLLAGLLHGLFSCKQFLASQFFNGMRSQVAQLQVLLPGNPCPDLYASHEC